MANAYDSYRQNAAATKQISGAPEIERALKRGHDLDGDPFANFSYNPPRPQGPFRQFNRRSKYRAAMSQSRDTLVGSNSNLAGSLSGSSQNLLDPMRMMNMQEDARSRRISSEVMKHRLYESVIASPRQRRFSMRQDYYGNGSGTSDNVSYARMVQSVPVTPAHSEAVSPVHSPTSERRFMFGFFSRGTTPRGTTPTDEMCHSIDEVIEEGDSWKGLASLFKPQPRCIPANGPLAENSMEVDEMEDDAKDTLENRLRSYPVPTQFLAQQQQSDDSHVFLKPLPKPKPRRGRPSPQAMEEDTPPPGPAGF